MSKQICCFVGASDTCLAETVKLSIGVSFTDFWRDETCVRGSAFAFVGFIVANISNLNYMLVMYELRVILSFVCIFTRDMDEDFYSVDERAKIRMEEKVLWYIKISFLAFHTFTFSLRGCPILQHLCVRRHMLRHWGWHWQLKRAWSLLSVIVVMV